MSADLFQTSFEFIDDADVLSEPSEGDDLKSILLPCCVYTAVGLLLLLLAPEAPLSIRLLVIALALLTLKRWGGVLVLLLVQADLYFRESQRQSALSGLEGIAFVTIVLLILMFVARQQRSLQQMTHRSVIRIAKNLLVSSQRTDPRPESVGSSAARLQRLTAVFQGLALLFCCVASARILLTLIPQNREFTENLRELVHADPSLTAGALIFVGVIAFWIVASEISWRQLSPAQARVYLRSIFLKIHYGDLRMIVTRRLKLRMKEIAAGKSRRKNAARPLTSAQE